MWIGLERARVTSAFWSETLFCGNFSPCFFLYELSKSVTFSEINCWYHFLEVPWLLGCQTVPVWGWIQSGSCRSLLALWTHWELWLLEEQNITLSCSGYTKRIIYLSMVQCALTVCLAPLLTKGQQRKMLTPIPHFTFTVWKQGSVQTLWDEET